MHLATLVNLVLVLLINFLKSIFKIYVLQQSCACAILSRIARHCHILHDTILYCSILSCIAWYYHINMSIFIFIFYFFYVIMMKKIGEGVKTTHNQSQMGSLTS